MMRTVIAAFFVLLVQSAYSAPKPEGFADAERDFLQMDLQPRLALQVLMIGAGYTNAVPVASFTTRTFNAIKQFQTENGFPATGAFGPGQVDRLFSVAGKKFDQWGFELVPHPTRRVRIWVPLGLGLMASRNSAGISWEDTKKRVRLDLTTVPNLEIARNFDALASNFASEGTKINYKVLRRDWFVFSITTRGGVDGYLRYHQDRANVTGFTLLWNNANGDVSGERIAVLLSGALGAEMSGAEYPSPPGKNLGTAKTPTPPAESTSRIETPSTPPAAKDKPKEPGFSSGTGFFVSTNGLVTNAHVVSNCDTIVVKTEAGLVQEAQVTASDAANDLALLKVASGPKTTAKLRIGVRLGEGVAAFGYPHADVLASSGNFTLGNVTALSGMHDDSRYFQISAPIQSGNSGGPLMDTSGNVIGVVSAKLNALKVALQAGDLTQNVNFAVKSAILATFLDSSKVAVLPGAVGEKPLDSADLADRAKEISAFVLCRTK